jgi:hypothetical protein
MLEDISVDAVPQSFTIHETELQAEEEIFHRVGVRVYMSLYSYGWYHRTNRLMYVRVTR